MTGDHAHNIWVAAYEQGKAERVDIEIEDQVQARLHARTLEALGMAKRSARHGEAFSHLVRESGERE
jgi:Arc/MetJ family transcription regulator